MSVVTESTDILEDIAAAARELFGSGVQITRCEVGNVNTSCFIESGSGRFHLKAESRSRLPRFYSRQIDRDLEAVRVLSSFGVPCAETVAFGATPAGRPFLVSRVLEGTMLSLAWNSLSPSERLALKGETLELLERVNGISSPYFGSLLEQDEVLGRFSSWRECFPHLIRVAAGDCLTYGTLTGTEADLITEAAGLCARSFTYSGKPSFCHMDLHWYNLMVSGGHISGIIDFGCALYAPEYSDRFRLDGSFLHGSGPFFDSPELEAGRPRLKGHEAFSADLLNKMDYYVFLSMSGRAKEGRAPLLALCREYLRNEFSPAT